MQHLLGDGLLDAAILGRHSRRAVLEEMVQSGIDLDDLKQGIKYAMMENLMIQFVYPDFELPKQYAEVINSIDHIDIRPFADKLEKNKKLYIHHDIRPFDQLSSIKELDREFSRYIPWILKMTEGK